MTKRKQPSQRDKLMHLKTMVNTEPKECGDDVEEHENINESKPKTDRKHDDIGTDLNYLCFINVLTFT